MTVISFFWGVKYTILRLSAGMMSCNVKKRRGCTITANEIQEVPAVIAQMRHHQQKIRLTENEKSIYSVSRI